MLLFFVNVTRTARCGAVKIRPLLASDGAEKRKK